MFIFRLLNIIVGQKVSHNEKARSSTWKGPRKIMHLRVQKRIFYKGLFFISKELQLIQRITIGKVVLYISENYNQQSLSLSFSTSQKTIISKAFLCRSLHRRRLRSINPRQGKNQKKGKEKRIEKEKIGEERNNAGGGT